MKNSVYPSWRYHAEHEPRLVKDEATDAALGEAWVDSPAHISRTAITSLHSGAADKIAEVLSQSAAQSQKKNSKKVKA